MVRIPMDVGNRLKSPRDCQKPLCYAALGNGNSCWHALAQSGTVVRSRRNRLDFTVIGPAVNLAARIDGLCRDVGRPVLLSASFVATSGLAAQHLGAFSLKGLSEPQEIYTPPAGVGVG